ncbi:MAG: YkgJ family cysteine cluster protein [Myxococcota bacterium]|nr:YkgJ family cysteine cluster protein [Myxococcota bacterium]
MNRRDRRAAATLGRAGGSAGSGRGALLPPLADDRALAGIARARSAQAKATGELLDDTSAPLRAVQACARSHVHSEALGQPIMRNEPRIVCKEGCSWCCYLRVSSTPLEVLGIAEWLRSQLTRDELASLRGRARAVADETAGMTWRERPPRACPLLVGDRCRAYQARPLMCRGWHSFDVTPCRSYVEGNGDASADVNVRLIMLYQALLGGLEDAARERRLDGSTVDFAVALSVALESPDAMNRWLAGHPVFDGARIPANEPSPLNRLNIVP